MRILYFTRDYTPHDFRFLNALVTIGCEVHYLRLEDAGRSLEKRPVPASVRQIDWQWGKSPFDMKDALAAAEALRAIFERIQPDAIHSGPLPDVSYITALANLHPHVAMSWGFDLMRDILVDAKMRDRTAFALQQADWFLGDCFVERDAAVLLGLNADCATIFPWGIDPHRFAKGSSVVRDTLANKDEFLMLSLRSLEPNYRVDIGLCAFLQVAEKEPTLKLMILSDGSELEKLRDIASEAPVSVQRRILWIGRQPNEALIEYYRAADLYLSSSITDGSSVSLLEAMSCELPVLVSDIPGNCEWIDSGENGLLFPSENIDAMAEKMLFAVHQPEKLKQFARVARKRIEEKADWDKNQCRILEAYQGAVKEYHAKLSGGSLL